MTKMGFFPKKAWTDLFLFGFRIVALLAAVLRSLVAVVFSEKDVRPRDKTCTVAGNSREADQTATSKKTQQQIYKPTESYRSSLKPTKARQTGSKVSNARRGYSLFLILPKRFNPKKL